MCTVTVMRRPRATQLVESALLVMRCDKLVFCTYGVVMYWVVATAAKVL